MVLKLKAFTILAPVLLVISVGGLNSNAWCSGERPPVAPDVISGPGAQAAVRMVPPDDRKESDLAFRHALSE
jgi:hypothetical protein